MVVTIQKRDFGEGIAFKQLIIYCAFLCLVMATFQTSPINAATTSPTATYTVNSALDASDADLNDGICATTTQVCTLRAAVEQANFSGGIVDIRPGTYNLLNGSLVIDGNNVELRGAGETSTIINGNAQARVVDLVNNATGNLVVTINGVTIKNGLTASGEDGAGIRVNAGVTLNLTDSIIDENHSGHWGGGVFIDADASATIDDVVFQNNTATDIGGGLDNYGGTVIITESIFRNNRVLDGPGGGVHNDSGGVMTIVDSVIDGNMATRDGGGIYNFRDVADVKGSLRVQRTAIINNEALQNGGGIYNFGLLELLENVTVSNNQADDQGGGIFNQKTISLINHVTIYENSAAVEGGGIYNATDSTAKIKNSIIANNSLNNCKPINPIVSLGYNVESSNSCGLGNGVDAVNDQPNTDPSLNSLQDNGGESLTHKPIFSLDSPVIEKADRTGPPLTDQRGITRPQGNRADIGAYEVDVADLRISKRGSPESVYASHLLTYTITVGNDGQSQAINLVVEDSLPSTVIFQKVMGDDDKWRCNQVGSGVSCTRPNLRVDEQREITIVVIAPPDGGMIENSVTVKSETIDLFPDDNLASVETTVVPVADLSLTKEDNIDPVNAAEKLQYELTVTNNGPSSAENVVITDTLMAGVDYLSKVSGANWSCTPNLVTRIVTCNYLVPLPNGASSTVILEVNAPKDPGPIYNTATVSSKIIDLNPENNSAEQFTTVIAVADLSVTKEHLQDNIDARGLLTYTVTVDNNGPSSATDVVLTDTLATDQKFVSATGTGWVCEYESDTHEIYCRRDELKAILPTQEITIVTLASAEGGILPNHVNIRSDALDFSPANNQAMEETTIIAVADLVTSQTHDPEPVLAETPLSYTVLVENFGPSSAENVSVSLTRPNGSTFISATGTNWKCNPTADTMFVECEWQGSVVGVGQLPLINLSVSAPPEAGLAVNHAKVKASTKDRDSVNNVSTEDATVSPKSDLSITLSDLPDPVDANGIFTYSLLVENHGPSTATDLSVVDTLPSVVTFISAEGEGWLCQHDKNFNVVSCDSDSLASDSMTSITIVVRAPASADLLTNTASVNAEPYDHVAANNVASTETTVGDVADLSVMVTANPNPVDAKELISYVYAVHNAGPSKATNVTLIDQLPALAVFQNATGEGWDCVYNETDHELRCTTDQLGLGLAPEIVVALIAPDEGDTINDLATVSAETHDPETLNNSNGVIVTVRPISDLSIQLDSPESVNANTDFIYTLNVSNTGPSTAVSVEAQFVLPVGTTFIGANGNGWLCEHRNGVVNCTRPTLASMNNSEINIIVTAPKDGGEITGMVDVTSSIVDKVQGNNDAESSTRVNAVSDMAVSVIEHDDPVDVSSLLSYTVFITNHGPSYAEGIVMIDTLSPEVTYYSSSSECAYNSVEHKVSCQKESMMAGDSAEFTIVVVAPTDRNDLDNTAQVEAKNILDPNMGNNVFTINTATSPISNLGVTIQSNLEAVEASSTISYAVIVENQGPSIADSVLLSVTIPADAELLSVSGSGWTCIHDALTATCLIDDLGVGFAPAITLIGVAPHNEGELIATAIVSSRTPDFALLNNSSETSSQVVAVADFSVTVEESEDPVYADHLLTYTIAVTNSGPSDIDTVEVVNTLPPEVEFEEAFGENWECLYTDGVEPIVRCTPTVTITVGSADPIYIVVRTPVDAGFLDNTVRVTTPAVDYDRTNNAATEGTVVTPIADLAVSVEEDPDPVYADELLVYTIEANNLGPSVTELLTVTHQLPVGSRFSQVKTTGWSCHYDSYAHAVICLLTQLPVGDAPKIDIVVFAPSADQLTDSTTTISASTLDLVSANNQVKEETMVTYSADVMIWSYPQSVIIGETNSYDFVVTNRGPGQSRQTIATIILPKQTDFMGCTPSCEQSNGVVKFDLGTMDVNQATKIQVDVRPNTTLPIVTTASVASAIPDLVPTNNEIGWLINNHVIYFPIIVR